nr:solute carrier family 23 protein [Shewanella marina]
MTKLNLGDINEKIPLQKAIYLGIQHVLAMDLYIVPIILAGILAFNTQDSAALIQMTFIVAGIATLIQSGFSLKLPVMQGPSYIPLGAIGALGKSYGMAAVYGALIPVGIAIFLLGKPLNKFSQLVRKFVPPIVGGTVIVIVGISLIPVAFSGIYTGPTPLDNMAVAGASAALLTGFILIGCFIKAAHWMRLTSVLLSMVFGTLVASQYGMVDFSSVADAPWFALPELMPFGTPEFHLVPIATMMFIALIVLIETTGTWCAVSAVTGAELTDEKVNAGANGEGIGYFICSLFGGSCYWLFN